VVGGCTYGTPQTRGHAEDRLVSGGKGTKRWARLQLPRLGVECQHIESAPADQLIDAAVDAFVRQVDQSFSGQAARLTKIGKLGLLIVAALDGAGQLRQCKDRHIELAGQN